MADGLMNNPYLGLLNMGLSPEQAQAQIDERRALEFANLNPQQRMASGIYQGITGIGRALGAKDPMLEQASQIRALQQQFDTQTSEGMTGFARALESINPSLAAQAGQMARKMRAEEADIASKEALTRSRSRENDPRELFIRANADKFTPASIQNFSSSGNYSDLKEITKEAKDIAPSADFAAVAGELNFGVKNKIGDYSPEQLKAINQTLFERAKAKTPKTVVEASLNMKNPQDVAEFRSKLLGTVAKQRTSFEAADTAVTLAEQALDTGNFAAAEGVASMLAKASGDTQLSNKDIQKYRTDPSFVGTVADVTARLVKGTPTKDTLTQLKKYAEVLRKKQEDSIQLELDVQRKLAKSAGIKDQDINDAFSGIVPGSSVKITLSDGTVVDTRRR
jgi:hypothetical protein